MKRIVFPLSTFAIFLIIALWPFRTPPSDPLPATTSIVRDDVNIRIKSVTNEMKPMKEQRFEIVVEDAKGNAIKNANVRMQILMPNMFCGIFQAKVRLSENGDYEATVIPVMKGRWEAEAVILVGEEEITVRHPFAVV